LLECRNANPESIVTPVKKLAADPAHSDPAFQGESVEKVRKAQPRTKPIASVLNSSPAIVTFF